MPSIRLQFTRAALTDIQAEPKRSTYIDTETRGLTLDVTPNGIKSFRIYRKVAGKPERIMLGHFNPKFPDSRDFPNGTDLLKISLSRPELNVRMARRLADAINLQLDSGANIAETKRKARGELTLGKMFDRFVQEHAIPQGLRTIDSMQQVYERFLGEVPDLPAKKHGQKRTKSPVGVNWHNRKLSTITPDEVRRLQMAIGRTLSGASANQVIDLLSRIFNKAIDWGEFTGRSPVDGLPALPVVKRDRFLKPAEMPAFWAALDEELSQDFKDYVMLSILTGARSGNTQSMRWTDIDLEASEWRIPEADSKNGETLRIILVPEATEILKRRLANATLPLTWVFTANSRSGHMSTPRKRWEALLKRAGIAQLRFHDLRRSLGSWQARTGSSLLIIGKSLGHKSHEATQIYARLDTDPVRESVERATAAMLAAAKIKF